jgi:surfactin synthase thioesterase subunit
MASHYIKALRARSAQWALLFGRLVDGRVVAFEMARQLQASGQTIALLAMVDTQAPNTEEKSIDDNNATLLIQYAQDLGFQCRRSLAPLSTFRSLIKTCNCLTCFNS